VKAASAEASRIEGWAMQNKLLTPDEVSERLCISRRSLYELLRRECGLPVVRLGRAVRFRSVDVEEFVAKLAKESVQ
jgi:excisionase family DNA binding protein